MLDAMLKEDEVGPLFLRHSEDLLSVHDILARILYTSDALVRLTGYRHEEVVGKEAYSFVHPDDMLELLSGHAASSSPTLDTVVQFRIRRKDGAYLWVESRGRLIEDVEHGELLVVVTRDISHRAPTEARHFGRPDRAPADGP